MCMPRHLFTTCIYKYRRTYKCFVHIFALCSLARRPLSAQPRSRLLGAASSFTKDDTVHIGGLSPQQLEQHPYNTTFSSSINGAGKARRRLSQQSSDSDSVMGPGFKGDLLRDTGTLGRYNQIFPTVSGGEERRRYLKIMATSSDCYADQRCGCAWCSRRLRVRHMASTALEIYSATGNMRHRPFSASATGGVNASSSIRRPTSAIRSAVSQQTSHDSTSRVEASFTSQTSTTPCGTPPVHPLGDHGPNVYAAEDSIHDSEECSSASPKKSVFDLSSKMDRHLAKYLKALHSSGSRYRRTPTTTSVSKDQGGSSGEGSHTVPAGTPPSGSLSTPPMKSSKGSGCPRPPTASSPSLVPRVARLASARQASHGPPVGGIDHQIQAMRVVTGALLSNSFVSCYSSGFGREGRSSLSRSVSAQRRVGSARPPPRE